MQTANWVRRQREETSHSCCRSSSPSSYRTPFYLSGRSKIEASAFELTWRKHPVEYHAGGGKHRVACRCGTPAANLMRSLVTSIFLYASKSWTLTAELQRRIQAMEIRCYHKILHMSYKDHVTNEEFHAKILQAIGPHEDLLTIVKRCKLQWFGHVSCSSGLAKTISQGTVRGGEDKADRRWEDNIRE